jgi:hypothetical protein
MGKQRYEHNYDRWVCGRWILLPGNTDSGLNNKDRRSGVQGHAPSETCGWDRLLLLPVSNTLQRSLVHLGLKTHRVKSLTPLSCDVLNSSSVCRSLPTGTLVILSKWTIVFYHELFLPYVCSNHFQIWRLQKYWVRALRCLLSGKALLLDQVVARLPDLFSWLLDSTSTWIVQYSQEPSQSPSLITLNIYQILLCFYQ